ncbi:MAG: hypothetical protein JWO67_6964 [Streptosporangiaceae bacterium]|nr:hypothetical protein [Streptosporangiaceae bacterium]
MTRAGTAAPDYSVLLFATATGQVVDALPWSDWSFTDTLAWSAPGSLTVTVPLLGRDQLGPMALGALNSIRQVGQGYSLCLVRDGRALFAGPCATMTYDEATAQVGCTSLGKLFDGRMVIQDPFYATPATAPDINLSLTPPDLAIELLTRGTTGAGRTLPLTLPAETGVGGPTVNYVAADLGTVYDRVNEVVSADGGPDVFLQPNLSTDQSTVTWNARVGRPLLGFGAPVATFDLQSGIDTLAGTDDYTQLVTTGYVPGDTSSAGGARILGISAQAPSGASLVFERADRTSASNANQDQVNALAVSFVSTYSKPVQTWTATVFVDAHPYYLDEWTIGDVVKLDVRDHPLIGDGEYLQRIVGVTSHTPTTVQLVTTGVPAGMATS